MKAFDLEQALAGHRVCTRDGRPVTQLVKFDCDNYQLAGVLQRRILRWDLDGANVACSDFDLFMAPIKKTGWVARYKEGGVCGTFATEERARAACGHRTATYHKIEWEE